MNDNVYKNGNNINWKFDTGDVANVGASSKFKTWIVGAGLCFAIITYYSWEKVFEQNIIGLLAQVCLQVFCNDNW